MSEIKLLQEYARTLELENEAKNKQRTILYKQIDELTQDNQRIYAQINRLKNIQHIIPTDEILQQKQHYIVQLSNQVQYLREQLESLMRVLQEKDAYTKNMEYQQEKDAERIIDLEKMIKQNKKNQTKLKEEIHSVRQQNRVISQELQHYSDAQSYEHRINELIENYEKIQQIAKEKQIENQYLKEENESLQTEIEELKQMIEAKDNELQQIKKNNQIKQQYQFANGGSSGIRERQNINCEEIITNMDLIRQNNKLIQRITQLEKQKNFLYIESSYKGRGPSKYFETPSISPLRRVSSHSNTSSMQNSSSKLRLRIEALKHENEELLESLRI